MKKLSICIPTYNRVDFLKHQVETISKMIKPYQSDVEFIISDNSSTDGTKEYLDSLNSQEDIIINHNPFNVGLIGNLMKLISISNSEYIWMIGDDDFVYSNSLEKVMKIFETFPDIEHIFINYTQSGNGKDSKLVYEGTCGYYENGIPFFIDMANRGGIAVFMFITAHVYKRENIIRANSIIEKYDSLDNLAIPMSWSLYNLNGKTFVTSESFLDERWDPKLKSWKKSHERVYCRDQFAAVWPVAKELQIENRVNCDLISNIAYPEVRYSLVKLISLFNGAEDKNIDNTALKWMWKHHKLKTIYDYLTFPFWVVGKAVKKKIQK